MPKHTFASGPALAVGSGLMASVADAEAVQPPDTVTVTVNVAAVKTVMLAAVAPVLHANVLPPEAVSTEDAPAQISKLPEMLAVGAVFSVTVTAASSVQPLALVTVTE